VDEVMVGLNDLHLALGLANQFELVASPLMDLIAREVRQANLPFGFGGLSDPINDALPVPPRIVHAQYPRLDATSAFVARKFQPPALGMEGFAAGIERCRSELDYWSQRGADKLAAARQELAAAAQAWRSSAS
jgi:hypothetical protein